MSRETGEVVAGSPLNALSVDPPFKGYHFIDLNGDKADLLRGIVADHPSAFVHHGDCNRILLNDVFPKVSWKDFKRALCVLDPYALNLNWEVMKVAGAMGSIELFLNFMVMDMNRNVLWRKPERVPAKQIKRMDAFWGDDSWREAAYRSVPGLFHTDEEKTTNEQIVEAFRERLKRVAGFKYVPEPIPMINTTGAVVYYLFFASQKPVARKIVEDIFRKYRQRASGYGH